MNEVATPEKEPSGGQSVVLIEGPTAMFDNVTQDRYAGLWPEREQNMLNDVRSRFKNFCGSEDDLRGHSRVIPPEAVKVLTQHGLEFKTFEGSIGKRSALSFIFIPGEVSPEVLVEIEGKGFSRVVSILVDKQRYDELRRKSASAIKDYFDLQPKPSE